MTYGKKSTVLRRRLPALNFSPNFELTSSFRVMNCRWNRVLLALMALTFVRAFAQDAPTGMANQPPPPSTAAPAPPPPPKTLSPVIWTENPDVVQRFNVDGAAAREMVNRSILKLTSASDLGTAWTRLGITPQDTVAIKITTMGGPLLSTHRAIVQAICDGLAAAGVPPQQIIIWDKDASDMRSAGYLPVAGTGTHVGIGAVFPGIGYDSEATYQNGILGTLIWGDSDFIRRGSGDDELWHSASDAVKSHQFGGDSNFGGGGYDSLANLSAPQTSNKSYFARIVTTGCTKIINVPVLTDNPYVGINGCLASLALACVDNNRRFQGDPTYGDPAICEILSKDYLRRKVVVNILDALVAEYAGGPRFDPQFTRSIGAIYVSRDPVAIDAIVLKRLEKFRAADHQGQIDPIGKTASHVHSATGFNLGTDDPSRIQLIRLP
jgi:uncharacterized protein (DUF362 family)